MSTPTRRYIRHNLSPPGYDECEIIKRNILDALEANLALVLQFTTPDPRERPIASVYVGTTGKRNIK
jgi:hypothetical protein